MANSKPRIWELDALRGVCILCVIVVHFLFDLSFFGGLDLTLPAWYVFIQEYGGAIFVVLSGVCVTLGSKSVRRGLIVFACGMLITAVTYGMYRLGMSGADVVVKFGVLHLLGVCMLVYPAFKKLPPAALALLGLAIAITGYAIRGVDILQDFKPNDVHHIVNHSESTFLFTSDNIWENLEEEALSLSLIHISKKKNFPLANHLR